MSDKYESLKLCNQLCFPLYAASREITKRYKPLLDKLDLTYTQYIAMMVMWEHKEVTVKEMGECLFLDSGTLTPVLKKLEQKGYVLRQRSTDDERVMNLTLTDKGLALRDDALYVPKNMGKCVTLELEEAYALYKALYKLLGVDPKKL